MGVLGGGLRYECDRKNCMLGVIPMGRIFMSSALCITAYIHYLHVTAAQFYLRLAGERVGRWNEMREWGDTCYNY